VILLPSQIVILSSAGTLFGLGIAAPTRRAVGTKSEYGATIWAGWRDSTWFQIPDATSVETRSTNNS
jgi:hypothetical protein